MKPDVLENPTYCRVLETTADKLNWRLLEELQRYSWEYDIMKYELRGTVGGIEVPLFAQYRLDEQDYRKVTIVAFHGDSSGKINKISFMVPRKALKGCKLTCIFPEVLLSVDSNAVKLYNKILRLSPAVSNGWYPRAWIIQREDMLEAAADNYKHKPITDWEDYE